MVCLCLHPSGGGVGVVCYGTIVSGDHCTVPATSSYYATRTGSAGQLIRRLECRHNTAVPCDLSPSCIPIVLYFLL